MFAIELSVRDYECDLQGIVNNSTYLNYLEHTRHSFLQTLDLDFVEITHSGVHLVVAKMELHYKKSLQPRDAFTSTLRIESATKVKVVFAQQIIMNNAVYFDAKVVVVAVDNGKIIKIPPHILQKFTT